MVKKVVRLSYVSADHKTFGAEDDSPCSQLCREPSIADCVGLWTSALILRSRLHKGAIERVMLHDVG